MQIHFHKNRLLKWLGLGILGTLLPTLALVGCSMLYFGPNYPKVKYYYWKGTWAQQQGDLKAAIIAYNSAIHYDTTHVVTYISRGSAYLGLKNYKAAIANYTKAIALSPSRADVYAYRGRAYYEIQQVKASLADYDKAIALDTTFGYAFANRGLLKYTLLHDFDGGCSDLYQAASLGDATAKQHLKEGACE
ncbi:MAG: hypothetical protein RL607_245 [Bacteroidota bacterium]|jgi:tetratricopeptide (TPR) repeat protein